MSGYYSQIRSDALALLPRELRPKTVLDVGCGEGATSVYLKETYGAVHVIGIEVNPAAARVARARLEQVIESSVESPALDLPAEQFDLILCLDVLEHLIDPWRTLTRLAACLKQDGLLLISLPNVQNWRVLLHLMTGRWDYQDSGLMDRTHLRFFTERTARRLIRGAGLQVVAFRRSMGPEVKLLNALTFGCFRSFISYHLYFLVRKATS